MCFACISEQTEIIYLYSINLSVFITEAECLLRGTNWIFKSDRYIFVFKGLNCVQGVLDRRFRYIRLQIPTSSIILWTALTRQPMPSASFPDIHGHPGDLLFFIKLIELASNRFADRTVSSICTEETARHSYSGFVFGQLHDAVCFLSHLNWQDWLTALTAYGACAWDMRKNYTRECLQAYVSSMRTARSIPFPSSHRNHYGSKLGSSFSMILCNSG